MVVDGHHFKNESYNDGAGDYMGNNEDNGIREYLPEEAPQVLAENNGEERITDDVFEARSSTSHGLENNEKTKGVESTKMEEVRKKLEETTITPNLVTLRVESDTLPQSTVRVDESEPLENLKNQFCTRNGMQPSNVRLFSNGRRINPPQTARDLQLRNGDSLEIRANQTGG